MTSKTFSFHVRLLSLLLLMNMMGAANPYASSQADAQSKQATSAAGLARTPHWQLHAELRLPERRAS